MLRLNNEQGPRKRQIYQVLALHDDAILRSDDPLDQPGLPLILASDDHHLAAENTE
jgi:hypothetical protein